EDPTWAVTVAGVPACRIRLSAQAASEEIRKVFCSEDYALDLIDHCATAGFVPTMQKVNAEFWANHVSDAKVADRFKSEAKAVATVETAEYIKNFKENFFACLNLAVAGINKNF